MFEKSSLPKPVRVFIALSITLTVASLLFSLICRRLGLGLPYSFAYYFVPGDMFHDFNGFETKLDLYGTPRFFTTRGGYFMYPAPMLFVVKFFWALPLSHHYMVHFFVSIVLLTTLFIVKLDRILSSCRLPATARRLLVSVVLLTSYPLVFEVQRGNFEFVIWAFTALALWLVYTDHYDLAAIALGFAIAFKLYPFMFLGLFLPAKKYRAFVLACLTAALLLVASYAAIGPTIGAAYAWNAENLAQFGKFYAARLSALGYDHSLFALAKFVTAPFHLSMQPWVRPYNIFAAVTALILYFGRIWFLPLPNQILAISLISTLIPPVSFDYTLLTLYPAFVILLVLTIQAWNTGRSIRNMTFSMVLFAIIFTPESYCILKGVPVGAQVRCLAMLILLGLTLKSALPVEAERLDSREAHA